MKDPFKVETFILYAEWKNKTKNYFMMAYQHYCKVNGIKWTRPNLKNERFPVKIPTEEHARAHTILCGIDLLRPVAFKLERL
jgi:hypothetical protein